MQPRARARWAEFLELSVDTASERPLFQQIYLGLRGAIMANVMAAGSRLPSTRALAARLGVSRTSVLSAYGQLLAEGYIEGRAGSGTFVSHDVPPPVGDFAASAREDRPGDRRAISFAARRCREMALHEQVPEGVPFSTGFCSVDAATVEAWRRVNARRLRTLDPVNLGYSDPIGRIELRTQVAEYLRAARAVRCEPEQIIIVSGAQQAIDLSARVLLDPGDEVWVEDPGYLPTRAVLRTADATLVPVPLDGQGLLVEAGIARAARARAAYVTPSHQYPTGAVLSMPRRLELLGWARDRGSWIIEDDYDSEFRYVGRSLASLQGLDAASRVIYVGTLSKVLFPGVRIGFAVVPRDLVDAFAGARFLIDRQPPTFQQAVVADFMRDGFLTGHIRRMRARYREARDVVTDIMQRRLEGVVAVETPEAGMQLIVHFAAATCDVALAREARRHGIVVRAVSPMYMNVAARSGLVLGFTGFEIHALRTAANRLADLILAAAAPSD